MPTSNKCCFQVRHGGRCFDPPAWDTAWRLCSRCLTDSCYLSCLRGQRAHRYLCISVRQMICRVLRVEHSEPASSWHLSFHHIGIESSKLRRPPCEHWEQIICCFISFCEHFQLWSQIVCVKYRLNHIHIIIIWRKKIFFWPDGGGTFRLVPPSGYAPEYYYLANQNTRKYVVYTQTDWWTSFWSNWFLSY